MININLLPPELKLKRIKVKHNASLMGVCLVIVIATIVLGVIASSAKKTLEAHLGNTQDQITSADKDKTTQELIDMALLINDRATTYSTINKTRAIWSQVLQELSNDTPADVQFETFTANSEKSPNFVLSGNTSSEREIIKFKDKLSTSSFFKNVTFKDSSLNAGQTGAQAVKFTLEFDLAKFASASTTTSGGSQ